MSQHASLAARFAALHAERERTWPADKLRGNVDQRAALVRDFDPDRVVKAGDRVASFTLEGPHGATLTLDALTGAGPLLLIFYRFSGCPACNIALPFYDAEVGPALDRTGVRVVAVSPHLQDQGASDIAQRHQLSLEIATDRDNRLARALGLTFVPIGDPPAPTADPAWVGALTGTGTWELPQPAVVLIDRDHRVRFADVSPDWMARTEAEPILAAVDALRIARAA